MKGLVDAFAQYARLPSPRIERLEINDLVAEVLHMYEGGVPIERHLAEGLPPVAGDPALLGQVLVNLVKNAQEALETAEAPLISVTTALHGSQVSLCVQDNGHGFPEELWDRLFEPYVTSKPKGTGLGLPVVKKIVEEHHGSIAVDNPETGGARICVSLPALMSEDEQHA
jgi:nitrogen fixation/metabolism regulation signal transduction histidine kinase